MVCELFVVGLAALFASAGLTPHSAMLSGLIVLPLSLTLLILAENFHLLWLMLAATALGGVAAALGYRGSLQVVNAIARERNRSEVVSAYLIALFVGNSVPIVGIGLLAAATNVFVAHMSFGSLVAVFAIVALMLRLRTAHD